MLRITILSTFTFTIPKSCTYICINKTVHYQVFWSNKHLINVNIYLFLLRICIFLVTYLYLSCYVSVSFLVTYLYRYFVEGNTVVSFQCGFPLHQIIFSLYELLIRFKTWDYKDKTIREIKACLL
jgi:hypothetical protein